MEVGMRIFAVVTMAGVLALAGCPPSPSILERPTTPDRAKLGEWVIATPPQGAGAGSGGVVVADEPGEWKYTVPSNVTQVTRRMADWDRISLYMGAARAMEEPFMVITVGGERASHAETETTKYKVTGKREYVMNGNIAKEWTGQTSTGAGFCELIVRRPGTAGETGEVCHALATARDEDEQKVALAILGSITWETAGK
jgi:hypothetical protein